MKGQTLQEWAGKSRMFALVFTDIVDSTALANELRDEKWIEVLLKHFAQARSLMEKYDHHEIKIIGDSFMVVFRDVLAALDFTLAFHEYTGDDRIRIRAGIHVGPARIIGDDIYGIMVNYTKRVESTKNDFGLRISDVAKTHIENEGAERHSRLRFGRLTLKFKGFLEPQIVWSVIAPINPFSRLRLGPPTNSVSRVPEMPAKIPPRFLTVPTKPRDDE